MIALFTLIYLAVSAGWADLHANKIKQGREPGGIADLFLRVFVGWVFSFLIVWTTTESILMWLFSLVYLFGVFWLSFDLALNYYRDLKLTYVSTTNGKFLDKVFGGKFWIQLTTKILIIGIGLTGMLCVN